MMNERIEIHIVTVQEIGNGRAASGLVVAYITQNMSS
jgi:hypothetical protein